MRKIEMVGLLSLVISFLITLSSLEVFGNMESAATLPQGVSSPNFIVGNFSGISERFNSSGLVEGVTAQYHVELTGKKLSLLNSDLNRLVTRLNDLSDKQKIGYALNLGSLDFKANPIVNYFVPTYSYGLTKNFTIGFGIPIVHYKNDVQVLAGGESNIASVREHVGDMSLEMSAALNSLQQAAANLPTQLQSVLALRGYKALRSVDYTTLGDFQVSGVYRYFESDRFKLAVRPYIQFPTGKADDPDDLVDISTGNQPAIGAYSIHELRLWSRALLSTAIGYQANIQDSSSKRVPINSDDIIPDSDRKDTLRRHTGNSTFLEVGSKYEISHPLSFAAFYEVTFKDPDWFDGDKGWDYSLLSRDTASQSQQIKLALEFSTINFYSQKLFSFPLLIGYVFGNTIYAINAPLAITNQLYMRVFF